MPSIHPTPSRSSNLDGVIDGTPLQKHSDSGVELTGSSNNSRSSTLQDGTSNINGSGTIRQDFAMPNRAATAASSYTTPTDTANTTRTAAKPAPARRKPPTKATPAGKIMATTAIFSKKASRVAMPLPKSTSNSTRPTPPVTISPKANEATARPRLSRVFSNPSPNPVGVVSQYRPLHHAQLDGAADLDADGDGGVDAEEAEDDELIDPLDARHTPTRTTRRRGVTEAGSRPVSKGLPTWEFGHVRGVDDVFLANENVENDEEEDAMEADMNMATIGHEHAWIAHPALLPIMPRMDGRRWSFDL